jgi:hypothetical protein
LRPGTPMLCVQHAVVTESTWLLDSAQQASNKPTVPDRLQVFLRYPTPLRARVCMLVQAQGMPRHPAPRPRDRCGAARGSRRSSCCGGQAGEAEGPCALQARHAARCTACCWRFACGEQLGRVMHVQDTRATRCQCCRAQRQRQCLLGSAAVSVLRAC